MIIRRFAQALKQQDWVIVAVEFVLIVVGVLFALQVDTWNQQRNDRELELRYASRLQVELQGNIDYFQDRLAAYNLNQDNLTGYYNYLAGNSNTMPPLDSLNRNLCKYGINYYSAYVTSVYEELVSSGRLALMTRVDAVDALQELREALRGREVFMATASTILREVYRKLDPYRTRVPIGNSALEFVDDASRESCVFKYDEFANFEGAASLVAELQGSEFAFNVAFKQLLDTALSAKAVLEAAYPQVAPLEQAE